MDNPPTPTAPLEPQPSSVIHPNKRPWSVTLLALVVLIITAINLTRLVLSIREWGFLTSRLAISPIYLALTGLVWSVAGLFLLWGLWKAKIWAPRLMQTVALTYALYYWLDHIFLMEHSASGMTGTVRVLLPTNWQFSAGVTIVGLAYVS